MNDSNYKLRFDRERAARIEAERLLEEKSLEVYQKNQLLLDHQNQLEETIQKRTSDLIVALQKAIRAEQANASILEFLNHELFTPLNAISGATALVKSSPLTPFQFYQIKHIENAYITLLNLCHDGLEAKSISPKTPEHTSDYSNFHADYLFQNIASTILSKKGAQQDIFFRYRKQQPIYLAGSYTLILDAGKNTATTLLSHFTNSEIDFHFRVTSNSIQLEYAIYNREQISSKSQEERTDLAFAELQQQTVNKTIILEKNTDSKDPKINVFRLNIPITVLDPHRQNSAVATVNHKIVLYIKNRKVKEHVSNILTENGIHYTQIEQLSVLIAHENTNKNLIAITDQLLENLTEQASLYWIFISNTQASINDKYYSIPAPFMDSDLLNAIEFYSDQYAIKPPTQAKKSQGQVLVVDDIDVNREMIKQVLLSEGFQITTANDGVECLNILKTQSFDAIIMDIQMPIMDGIEATKAIRALAPPINDIPVIALTAQRTSRIIQEAMAVGITHYMTKPFNSEYLITTLHELIRSPHSPDTLQLSPPPVPSIPNEQPPHGWINFKDSLPRVNNNRDMLLIILNKFAQKNVGFQDRLNHLVEKNDFETLAKELHAMKGSSATIGALQLSAEAASLEKILKQNKFITIENTKNFGVALNGTIEEITRTSS